jgi:hypothetical protein
LRSHYRMLKQLGQQAYRQQSLVLAPLQPTALPTDGMAFRRQDQNNSGLID